MFYYFEGVSHFSLGYLEEIQSGRKSFEELANSFSDCSSAKRGGDLGPFGKGQMQRSFESAAFNLQVSSLNDLTEFLHLFSFNLRVA